MRPRTKVTYRAAINGHLVPALGVIPLRDVRPAHIKAYMRARDEEGASPQTIRNEFSTLRKALEVAVGEGYLERNYAKKPYTSAPSVPREEMNPLSSDEVKKAMAAAKGHPWEALFVLAAATGLRRAEVLGLTWPCVDLDGGTVRVEKTLQRYDRAFHMEEPKTRRSRRTVPIPSPVVEVLRAHRKRQVEARLASEVWLNEWDLVFVWNIGEPIEAKRLHDEFVALLAHAGVRRVRFHDLRHGAASVLFAQGATMKEIQETLGHSDIGITMNVYTHLGEEMRRGVADKMAAALFGQRAYRSLYCSLTPSARTVVEPPGSQNPQQSQGIRMVGEAGFEPTTPSPPDWCAARLRHSPTVGLRW